MQIRTESGEKARLFGHKCERDYLLMKKSVIKGKRERKREGEERKGEGSLKGRPRACSKWQ